MSAQNSAVTAAYLMTADGTTTMVFDLVEKEDWDESAQVTDYSVEIGADVTDNVRVKTAVCHLEIFATNEPIAANNWANAQLTQSSITIAPPGQTGEDVLSISAPGWDNGIALRAALMGVGDLVGGVAGGPVGTLVGGAVGALAGALFGGPGPTTQTVISPPLGLQPTPGTQVQASTYTFPTGQDFIQLTLNQLRTWKDASQLFTVVGTKNSMPNMVIEEFKTGADAETSGRTISLTLRQIRIVSTVTVALPAPTVPRATAPVNKGTVATAPVVPVASSLAYQALGSNAINATNGGPPITGNLQTPSVP